MGLDPKKKLLYQKKNFITSMAPKINPVAPVDSPARSTRSRQTSLSGTADQVALAKEVSTALVPATAVASASGSGSASGPSKSGSTPVSMAELAVTPVKPGKRANASGARGAPTKKPRGENQLNFFNHKIFFPIKNLLMPKKIPHICRRPEQICCRGGRGNGQSCDCRSPRRGGF